VTLYVYGVVRKGTPVPEEDRGLGVVEAVADGDLVAVCSRVDGEPVGRRRELRAHADVLGELARQSPVIPLVFGTVLPDEAAVRAEVLQPRADRLRWELERFADVVQMTVRLVPEEERLLADVMASSPDLRDLDARLRASRAAGSQAQQLRLGEAVARHYRDWVQQLSRSALDALAEHAVEARLESGDEGAEPAQAAFLVARPQLSEFLEAGGSVADGMRGRMVVRITGPLPPYSFVSTTDQSQPAGVAR